MAHVQFETIHHFLDGTGRLGRLLITLLLYKLTKETIRKSLKLHEIPLREKFNHHGNPAQIKYGQKKRNGELQEHKQEQRVVDIIRQMKEEGLGLRAIARCLNEMKIPTKCRGKSWHPQMVKRIMDGNR